MPDRDAIEPHIWARDLGVSVDNVIMGILRIVADDYNKATGKGMIPLLAQRRQAASPEPVPSPEFRG